MISTEPLLHDVVRLHQVGAGVTRDLIPDAETRKRIARSLDLVSLDQFDARLQLAPHQDGWRLTGRIRAEAVQSCGLTLEPLPISIDRTFSLDMVEAGEEDEVEVEVSLEDDPPDTIEDGQVDLGQYALEQLALSLDPFPRKPGAEFVQPAEPTEINPFAVLKQLRTGGDEPD